MFARSIADVIPDKKLVEASKLVLDVPKEPIRSMGEFWEVIEKVADLRAGAPLPKAPPDDLVFSACFQRADKKKEKPKAFYGVAEARADNTFDALHFESDDSTFSRQSERFALANKTNTELEMTALNVLSMVDVNAVYPPLEKATFTEVNKNRVYRNLLRLCKKIYMPSQTLAVGWDKRVKSFVLYINRAFCLKFCFHYLFGSWNTTNYEKLKREYKDYDVLVKPLQFLIMHEMGHILYLHTTKKANIYKEFHPKVANIYQDTLINLSLTSMMKPHGKRAVKSYQEHTSNIDISRAPLAGQTNAVHHNFDITGRDLLKFYRRTSRIANLSVVAYEGELDLDENVSYSGVLEENPLGLVRLGFNTSVVLKFYEALQNLLNAAPMVKSRFQVGSLVKNKKTEKLGTVVKVNKNGTYEVEYPK